MKTTVAYFSILSGCKFLQRSAYVDVESLLYVLHVRGRYASGSHSANNYSRYREKCSDLDMFRSTWDILFGLESRSYSLGYSSRKRNNNKQCIFGLLKIHGMPIPNQKEVTKTVERNYPSKSRRSPILLRRSHHRANPNSRKNSFQSYI